MKYIFCIAAFFLFTLGNANAQVAVIANNGVEASSLDAATISKIYKLAKKQWDNGTAIVVFDQKNNSNIKKAFYSGIGENPGKLKKDWLRAQLTGSGKAPKALGSDADVLKAVASTDGAIGFIDASKADGSVKILAKF